MSIQTAFADAITAYDQSKGIPSGYDHSNGKTYPHYLSKEAWKLFVNGMEPSIRRQYEQADGGELKEKESAPPKMAAFHSSSRFAYLLSRDCPDVVFEKQLPTGFGRNANLDGFLSREDRMVFAEAKCREPYGHPSPEKISRKYLPVYDYLAEKMPDVFGYEASPIDEKYESVCFHCKGRTVAGFDIKQMISHLLSVARYLLACDSIPDRIDFLYLLYDPAALPLKPDYREHILTIHRQVKRDAADFAFPILFGHIVDYVISTGEIPAPVFPTKVKAAFHFELCDQYDYPRKLK